MFFVSEIFALFVVPSIGFYLPGVSPRIFKNGEVVDMKVQALISSERPLQYDYYQLPFCKPEKVQLCGYFLNHFGATLNVSTYMSNSRLLIFQKILVES